MTNLEFIEKQIEYYEQCIIYWKEKIEEDKRFPFFSSYNFSQSMVEEHQEALQTLQRIKTELEAWETIKKHEFEIDRLDSVIEYWVAHIWKPFTSEEITKIKKSLED